MEWTFQISRQRRFQEYKEDYEIGENGDPAGDLSGITVPTLFFVADEDTVCTKALAEALSVTMADAVKYTHVFPRAAHDYFAWQNQIDFMNVLKTQITSDGAFEAMFIITKLGMTVLTLTHYH